MALVDRRTVDRLVRQREPTLRLQDRVLERIEKAITYWEHSTLGPCRFLEVAKVTGSPVLNIEIPFAHKELAHYYIPAHQLTHPIPETAYQRVVVDERLQDALVDAFSHGPEMVHVSEPKSM